MFKLGAFANASVVVNARIPVNVHVDALNAYLQTDALNVHVDALNAHLPVNVSDSPKFNEVRLPMNVTIPVNKVGLWKWMMFCLVCVIIGMMYR